MNLKSTLTKGTVPILILEILRSGEAYGYEIVKEITTRSGGELEFGQGTIYPILYKLQECGHVVSTRQETPGGKERRYYSITDEGLTHLEHCKKTWQSTSQAIGRVLGTNTAGISVAWGEI